VADGDERPSGDRAVSAPTLASLAAECDAYKELAHAYRRRITDGSDAARARCAAAEREVLALGLCVFTPSARDRVKDAEP
jgi:hypothetical protein